MAAHSRSGAYSDRTNREWYCVGALIAIIIEVGRIERRGMMRGRRVLIVRDSAWYCVGVALEFIVGLIEWTLVGAEALFEADGFSMDTVGHCEEARYCSRLAAYRYNERPLVLCRGPPY